MSAVDVLRSFAESRSHDADLLPPGSLRYGQVRAVLADLAAARAEADAHRDALATCADSHEEQRQELAKARAQADGLAALLRSKDMDTVLQIAEGHTYGEQGQSKPDPVVRHAAGRIRAALAAMPKEDDR